MDRFRGQDHLGQTRYVMTHITRILARIESGDPLATEQLLPLVYHELRQLAVARLSRERPGLTLQATALVHEVYLRLVQPDTARRWQNRAHFFGAAAAAMRRILVEEARKRGRLCRGGNRRRIGLEAALTLPAQKRRCDLLALDEALTRLAVEHPDKAAVVQLRYFAGLSWQEIADCQNLSLATVKRHWLIGRAWLYEFVARDVQPDLRTHE